MQSNPLPEQALPSDVNAEKSVLGAIILNPDLLAQALASLKSDDFYLASHHLIFDAMVSLRQSGNLIDTVTLPALLNERKELEQVGGITYLASLLDGLPQTDDIRLYCRIIKYKSRERDTIKILNHELSKLLDGQEELDPALERIQSKLAKIVETGRRSVTGVYSTLDTFFKAKLDEPEQILYGLHRGEVAGMFAVTNYGKTTVLYNISLSIAAGQILWPLAPIVPNADS